MLRRTNDSCSLLRHILSQHSHPERRTCHDVSFIPPVWHQAWICYDITLRLCVSYCLLFFISFPPVDLSLGLAVSGFVCVCLSVCSSVLLHIHLKGMLLSWMHRLSRQWEEIIPPSIRLSRLYLEYTQSYKAYCIWWTILGRKHNLKWIHTDSDLYWGNILSLQVLPPDLRLILSQWTINTGSKQFWRANKMWEDWPGHSNIMKYFILSY